ncbi:MAG: TPM domain-containing protein [Thermoanaerobaculia bacterium]
MHSSSNRSLLRIALGTTISMLLFAHLSAAKTEKSYAPWPEPGPGYVTDHADVLSDAQEEKIEQWLIRVEKESGVEIIVVTIPSMNAYPGTNDASIEAFARGLFNRWGIGNFPTNDGILLVVSTGDRNARIELGAGYGHARDAEADRIMERVIVPRFRKGDYAGGITDGVRAIVNTFTPVHIGFRWKVVVIPLAIVALALIGFSLLRSGKRGWGWVFIGLALALLLFLLYVLVMVMRARSRYGRSSGWSSGGFGGFGGGFSGGGGATGSW